MMNTRQWFLLSLVQQKMMLLLWETVQECFHAITIAKRGFSLDGSKLKELMPLFLSR